MRLRELEFLCRSCDEPTEPALAYEIDQYPSRVDVGLCRECWDELGDHVDTIVAEDKVVEEGTA
jgi:hypothetical protein